MLQNAQPLQALLMNAPQLGYRLNVGIMVLNRDNHVWLGCRNDTPTDPEGPGSWWQMPQGGIDDGEEPAKAMLRELWEETAIKSVSLLAESPHWHTYDLPPTLLGKAWGGKYRGQRQKWFAVRFDGSDDEISITPAPGHQVEFVSWRWAKADELPALIVPFKREVYLKVLAEFAHLTHSAR
jgi:putative (di)nucleoside polyphosphate hydrolase